MTFLGKTIITLGITILTFSALAWIVLSDWRWIAAGTAVFIGTLLSGAVLSVETKTKPIPPPTPPFPMAQPLQPQQPQQPKPATHERWNSSWNPALPLDAPNPPTAPFPKVKDDNPPPKPTEGKEAGDDAFFRNNPDAK